MNIPNLWTPYGLRSSPFFQDPLEPIEGALHPISLFVGREHDAQRLITRIRSNEGSRATIEGQAGIGKTTFIQYVKSRATHPPLLLSHARHIRTVSGMTYEGFGTDLVKTVLSTLLSTLGEKKLRRRKAVLSARRLVEESEKRNWSAGVSAFGLGASVGRSLSTLPPIYPPTQFFDVLSGLVSTAKSEGVHGVIVHVDNMENLFEAHQDLAQQLFRDIRDYLLLPGLHFLFAATAGFQSEVLARFPQVLSIFPDPLVLDPLSAEEIVELLEKRYAHLKLRGQTVAPPITEFATRTLFRSYSGDLRGMLNSLNDACEVLLPSGQGRPLELDRIAPALAPSYRLRLERDLTPAAYRHLETIATTGLPEFRQTDLAPLLDLTPGRVNQLFKDLIPARAVRLIETRGRSKIYALTGYAQLAFRLLV